MAFCSCRRRRSPTPSAALPQSQPLLQVLVADPSWRGLVQALDFSLQGIQAQKFTLDDMVRPLTMFAQPIEDVLAAKPASFSWRELVNKKPPAPNDLRRFIEINPVLDYAALEPGKKATDAIRQAAADLHFDTEYHARVRLTGAVAIQDEEFATLKDHATENAIGTIVVVLIILWLALKSPKIILAVFLSISMGLAMTAALGLWMVGALNPISIAFAVLFVGIGVDFGIQFSVRYRAERYEINNLRVALANTAKQLGVPLTLAATATACGFLSFLPTDYKGVSELGQIAGAGMIIAYLSTITLLPALLKVLNPPGEKEPLGYKSLAPVDRFMERHRIGIIVGTAVVVLGGLPLLYNLQFDFNPINLNSPKVELIATYLELRSDPATGASTIEVLAPTLSIAQAGCGAHEQAARGLAGHDHRELRAGRSAQEAGVDRPGRQGARPDLGADRAPASDRRRKRHRAQCRFGFARIAPSPCRARARRRGPAPPPPSGWRTTSPGSPRPTKRRGRKPRTYSSRRSRSRLMAFRPRCRRSRSPT